MSQCVTLELLHGRYIIPVLEQLSGKRLAERMAGGALGKVGFLDSLLHRFLDE